MGRLPGFSIGLLLYDPERPPQHRGGARKKNPQLVAAKLTKSQSVKLVEAIKLTLQKAIAAGGTTLRDFRDSEGKPGYFAQELWVYARQNQACKQCGHPVELIRQSQRATYFCPQCQKR